MIPFLTTDPTKTVKGSHYTPGMIIFSKPGVVLDTGDYTLNVSYDSLLAGFFTLKKVTHFFP